MRRASQNGRVGFLAGMLGSLLLGLSLACGGGGGGSSAPPPPPVTPPTLTSFSPSSGTIGTSVTLTGTALTGATAVSFGSVSAPSYSVLSATQVRAVVPAGAVSAPLKVTTPGGTATSSGSFTVSPSPVPTLSGFTPGSGPVGTGVTLTGTGFLGASRVAFNGTSATYTLISATEIATAVPSGATSGAITVTTPGGTATSSTVFNVTATSSLDLTIDGLYLTQASQAYPATVSLVANRSAWVRVFVKANQANAAQPQVQVTITSGGTAHTLTISAPGTSVPTSIAEGVATQSWNAAVPAAWIQPGMTVLATVDPGGAIPEADRTNNQYPTNGTPQALTVETLSAWKVRFIPVTTGDGRTGAVDATNMAAFAETAKRIHPMPDALTISLGSGLTSSLTTLTNDSSAWSTVLGEVTAKWTAEGRVGTYYGVVNPNYSSGIAGIGWVGQAVAIGWDKASSRAGVVAHEVGHTFGRSHAPCGSVASSDPNYPTTGDYAGGHIGVTGWDAFASSGNLKAAATYTDIMGYCSQQWVSDYTYAGVLSYRKAHPSLVPPPAPVDGLLVWGRVEGDQVILEPAIRVQAPTVAPDPGPYRWEARDSTGRLRLAATFQPGEVADTPGGTLHMFCFVVPFGEVAETDLQSLRVFKDGREQANALRLAPLPLRSGGVEEVVQVSNEPEGIRVVWDAGKYPLLVVRDSATGELLGFQRGGVGRIRTERRDLELLACDGVQTRVQSFQRRP